MNRWTLTFGLALMDTCWLYPWALLIGIWADPTRGGALLSAPLILLLLLAAAVAMHLLGRASRARPRGARLALAVLGLFAATIVVRLEHYPSANGLDWVPPLLGALAATIGQLSLPVLGFALALYLWWRGARLGTQTPGYADVESAFRWGIGRLAVFGLVMAISSHQTLLPVLESATTPYVVGFFFVSLVTLALGRLESLRTRTRRPNMNTQWLAVLVVMAAAVVLLALFLGQLVSFDVLIVATRPLFDLLGAMLLLLLYAIVIPLSWVIEWLVYLVLSLVQFNANRPLPQPPQSSDVDDFLQRMLAQTLSPEMLAALKAVGAALLVGVVLLLVARGLARWRPSAADADATNEERDSLWRADEAWARLLAWLRRLLRRERLAPDLEQDPATPPALESVPRLSSVRQLYARLLRAGEAAGVARAVATTPWEHMPALRDTLAPEDVITRITEAYVHVRYGEEQVGDADERGLAEELAQIQEKSATQ